MLSSADLMGGYIAYTTPEGVLSDAVRPDGVMPVTTLPYTPTISLVTLSLNCP